MITNELRKLLTTLLTLFMGQSVFIFSYFIFIYSNISLFLPLFIVFRKSIIGERKLKIMRIRGIFCRIASRLGPGKWKIIQLNLGEWWISRSSERGHKVESHPALLWRCALSKCTQGSFWWGAQASCLCDSSATLHASPLSAKPVQNWTWTSALCGAQEFSHSHPGEMLNYNPAVPQRNNL